MSGYEVEPAELFAAQAMVTETATEARAELSRLRAAAEDLLGHGWRGTAAAAFAAGWHDWAEGARLVVSALEETARALGVTAQQYEQNELVTTDLLRSVA